jgi:regulatory protein
VWKKRFGVLPRNQNEKARQVRFLQSRGFSLDVIFKVLKLAGSAED